VLLEVAIMMKRSILLFSILGLIAMMMFVTTNASFGQSKAPRFKALVMTEIGGQHGPFVNAAKVWLEKLAVDKGFTIDYIEKTDKINDAFLADHQVFIQLNFPPYAWNATAMTAFEKYIIEGKGGGWIGFHHASLLGDFDGYKMWPWFSTFMGGIKFSNYIAELATGTVVVEDKNHPALKGVPVSFQVTKDEWYTYDKSPRPKVHVLARVDESSYESKIKMGDHPVVWTNDHYKARNIYIFMGHHPDLFKNNAFTTLVRNSIFWAAKQ
jgi:type 1 glutamine amidotransferase